MYNTLGVEVASADTGLYTPTLHSAVFANQFGDALATHFTPGSLSVLVYTGSTASGLRYPTYELGNGGSDVRLGNLSASDGQWLDAGFQGSPLTGPLFRFYALSSPITVPVPEPSGIVLGVIAGLLVAVASRAGRRGRIPPARRA